MKFISALCSEILHSGSGTCTVDTTDAIRGFPHYAGSQKTDQTAGDLVFLLPDSFPAARRRADMDCGYTNYTLFSACFQLLFSPNFSDRICRKYSIRKGKDKKDNTFAETVVYHFLYTLALILASVFLEFNRISVNSPKIFPVLWKGFLHMQMGFFVCSCRKKRDHVVKHSKIFVFFLQTDRFFCISHCTFSIKKRKKLRKSLAKRLQV